MAVENKKMARLPAVIRQWHAADGTRVTQTHTGKNPATDRTEHTVVLQDGRLVHWVHGPSGWYRKGSEDDPEHRGDGAGAALPDAAAGG